jgi:carbon storage regulator
MLVLSRRVGESIVIGDDVVVTILELRGEVVRIGVDAPRSVQVRRQELLVELAETNRAAASPGADRVAGLAKLVARGEPGAPSAEPTTRPPGAGDAGPAPDGS